MPLRSTTVNIVATCAGIVTTIVVRSLVKQALENRWHRRMKAAMRRAAADPLYQADMRAVNDDFAFADTQSL